MNAPALTCDMLSRARSYVAKVPGAVSGASGHNQTFSLACALVHGFALTDADALTLLREYNQRCQPPWNDRELEHKIVSAMQAGHSKPRGHLIGEAGRHWAMPMRTAPVPAPPPKIDPVTATEIFLKGFRCREADLVAASECQIPPLLCGEHFHRQGAYLIDQLFEPGELVNIVFKSSVEGDKARPADSGRTLERNDWENILLKPGLPKPGGAWLRLNPLDGQGIADANVTAFRFALIECDELPMELQVPLLAKLPLPIAAIVSSGGRSLHAWVKVSAATLDEYRRIVAQMLTLLAKFGVDAKNKNPSRMSRLPGVARQIGATGDGRQRLLYLNPEPTQKAIL